MISKKIYYRFIFSLKSPLALSSGEKIETDKDLMKDSRDIPYIPASSIAGVCRNRFSEINGVEKTKYYFGDVDINTGNNKDVNPAKESKLVFYDATVCPDDENRLRLSVRDSVALDEYKTAKKGAKFDMEVLEPGIRFITVIEQDIMNNDDDMVKDIASEMCSGNITFGAKTMRGYGEIENVEVSKCSFNLEDKNGLEKWLDFDIYSQDYYNKIEIDSVNKKSTVIKLKIKQKGGISIRKYSTRPSLDKKRSSEPDYEQLTVTISDDSGENRYPVIPGTSWAGAFLHRMKELGLSDSKWLFGEVTGDKGQKSRIRFGESRLLNAKEKKLSRNAIDRFSGGTKDGALYTERTWYGGEGYLNISIPKDTDKKYKSILAAAITDLHFGFLAVGGLTSVGRGLFEITEINDVALTKPNNAEEVYKRIMEVL